MAQDFFAAFGRDEVGEFGTDTTINSGDITAILMVGLQGLDAQVRKDRHTIEAQASLLSRQTERLAQLERDRQIQAVEIADLKQGAARMARVLGRLEREGLVNTAGR